MTCAAWDQHLAFQVFFFYSSRTLSTTVRCQWKKEDITSEKRRRWFTLNMFTFFCFLICLTYADSVNNQSVFYHPFLFLGVSSRNWSNFNSSTCAPLSRIPLKIKCVFCPFLWTFFFSCFLYVYNSIFFFFFLFFLINIICQDIRTCCTDATTMFLLLFWVPCNYS